jgi:hypothetical protein
MGWKCKVCGGSFTCPANDYLAVRPPREGEVLQLSKDNNPGDGWVPTHFTKHTTTWVRKVTDDGYFLHIVGTAQAGRIRAHYGVAGTWVGMTKYAFFVMPNPEVWPPGFFPRWNKV